MPNLGQRVSGRPIKSNASPQGDKGVWSKAGMGHEWSELHVN